MPTTVAHQFPCCLPSSSTSSQVFFYTPSSSSQATITYTSEVCPSTSLWSHSQSHSPSTSLLPSTATLQQTASPSVLHHQQVRSSQNNARFYSPILPSQMTRDRISHHVPNTNPFYLKFITGNIQMCQGCRSTLRLVNGSVPLAPHDLTGARAEKQPYHDSSGNLITPQKESAAHYHCHVSCNRAIEQLSHCLFH